MAENKYWTLVRRLNAGTVSGKISWEQTSDFGTYQAGFAGFTIVLAEDDGRMEYMRLLNGDGEILEIVTDEDIDGPSAQHRPAYDLMRETYKLARRQVMGVDQALDAILGTLPPAEDEPKKKLF
jgi:hypothetical protein